MKYMYTIQVIDTLIMHDHIFTTLLLSITNIYPTPPHKRCGWTQASVPTQCMGEGNPQGFPSLDAAVVGGFSFHGLTSVCRVHTPLTTAVTLV